MPLQLIPNCAVNTATPPSLKRRIIEQLGTSGLANLARTIRNHIVYRGDTLYCPVCERSSSHFVSFGNPPRKNAGCVWCGSLERHRFLWLFWKTDRTDLLSGKPGRKMLHVAPEPFFRDKLRAAIGSGYLTSDYFRSGVDVQMDVQDIQYPDETFDIIYCSHVLEHVENDRKALAEFYRVLKTGGWAVLLVPDFLEHTVEDTTVIDAMERLRLFRQDDHVRNYGPDFADRAREAGFEVEALLPGDVVSRAEIEKMALIETFDRIYFCRKMPR